MKRLVLAVALFALVGCGPTYYEVKQKTTSELNVISQEWDGKENPPDLKGRLDPWGNQYTAVVEKSASEYKLVVRSNGKDGLPLNSDDLTVSRRVPHDEAKESRDRTVSELNSLAQEWDGKEKPPETKGRADKWGTPFNAVVTKETLNYKLTVRSAGPDRQMFNTDDIIVYRQVSHGQSSQNLENEKYFHSIFQGIWGGSRDGITGKEPKK